MFKNGLRFLGVELPIIQAPMAGVDSVALAAAVAEAGGLGSLACAMLTPEQLQAAWQALRALTNKPLNLNFFCHALPLHDAAREGRWLQQLAPHYRALQIDPANIPDVVLRLPFDDAMCAAVTAIRPEIVSFHFGLPAEPLLRRVKEAGAKILATATTVAEAVWLAERGCDAIIAQGIEAGGHRGMFLTDDLATQLPTLQLVPRIVAATAVPVIAAGGLADAAAIVQAFRFGAVGVQLGTPYLFCPEARVPSLYLSCLTAPGAETAVTNIYSGRPARGLVTRLMRAVGPMNDAVPAFPFAAKYAAPLRQKAEAAGSADFSQMWAGENFHAGRIMPAAALTRQLAEEVVSYWNKADEPGAGGGCAGCHV